MAVSKHSLVIVACLGPLFLLFLSLSTATNALALTESASIFRKLVATTETLPSALELTKALSDLSATRPKDEDWSEALGSGSPWKAYFSASQDALQAARSDNLFDDNSPCGRFLPDGFGCQMFVPTTKDTGTFTNEIAPLNGFAKFCLTGSYILKGRIMTLVFEELQVKLLWILQLPTVNVREGQDVRQWLEMLVRGGKKNTKEFEKRPNIYSWFYVDDSVCVARGSSGSVALWISDFNKTSETS